MVETFATAGTANDGVLNPDAELSRNVDAWLVGEDHPRLQRQTIAADKVRLLVSIESQTMA